MTAATWQHGMLLLVGGARSGKSRLAVDLALATDRPVVFVATAEAGDDEMADRIGRHRAERPAEWSTVEEPCALGSTVASIDADVFVIVDCMTLWVANLVMSGRSDDSVLMEAGQLVADLSARTGPTVVVTNEVGLGVHPETDLGRRYRDVLGGVNRLAAAAARRTLFLVAGRAVRLDDPRELLE
jgi:adenosyl cobinamide kinase/adenosyl cobinamide phosphate guanylyltransferase